METTNCCSTFQNVLYFAGHGQWSKTSLIYNPSHCFSFAIL